MSFAGAVYILFKQLVSLPHPLLCRLQESLKVQNVYVLKMCYLVTELDYLCYLYLGFCDDHPSNREI